MGVFGRFEVFQFVFVLKLKVCLKYYRKVIISGLMKEQIH